MGNTPRPHKFSVPMMTRSTDVSMMDQCEGRFWLDLFYEDKAAEASFFELGTVLHGAIEWTILKDWDLGQALDYTEGSLDTWIDTLEGKRVIETSNRGVDTIFDDAERMMTNWFKFAHPDSEKRHPIYDDYEWPPKVEVPFLRSSESAGTRYPVWGNIDAVFSSLIAGPALLIDWKSGSSRQRNSHQLHHYQFGVQLQNSRAAFHHLDRVKKPSIIQEADPYPGDAEVRARIIATEMRKEEVLGGQAPHFAPDWYCNYCPVQEFCPADGDPRNRETNLTNLNRMLQYAKPITEPYKKG